ncbi:cold-shock protein [Neisseria sp. CCUG12390]|uniref:cold-shock protein n=1 Tax=Neisseria sp. CCUG12390 TaxID=3392035 RepID=UPI003A10106A
MRYYGTIIRWNESRGFGAIREESTENEIFVPLSAFNGEAEAPFEGQRVSFFITSGRKGREEAQDVRFVDDFEDLPAFDSDAPYRNHGGRPSVAAGVFLAAMVCAAIGGGGWYGWQAWQNRQAEEAAATAQKNVSMVNEVAEKMKAERKAWHEAVKSPSAAKGDSVKQAETDDKP